MKKSTKKDAQQESTRPQLEGSERGVTVAHEGNQYEIAFGYNPLLRKVLKAEIPEAEFQRESKSWLIPAESQDNLAPTIEIMRQEHARSQDARQAIEQEATANGEVAKDAFVGEKTRTTGRIVAVNDYFCAQEKSQGQIIIHDRASLSQTPEVDAVKSIVYMKGLGLVQDQKMTRSNEQVQTHAPAQAC